MHPSSYETMEKFCDKYLSKDQNLKILDIGSFDRNGDYNYGNILNAPNWTYKGLDLKPGNNVDIVVEDPYFWVEIEDNSFDVIVSGQAFEHNEFFWLTLEEIKRVLKPGGLLCIIVPSTGPVHRNPVDCYRFNETAMKAMANYIDFEIIETKSNDVPMWRDSTLIARKPLNDKNVELEKRMDNLESKLDMILDLLK